MPFIAIPFDPPSPHTLSWPVVYHEVRPRAKLPISAWPPRSEPASSGLGPRSASPGRDAGPVAGGRSLPNHPPERRESRPRLPDITSEFENINDMRSRAGGYRLAE